MTTEPRVSAERLKSFCQRIFEKLDIPGEDARIVAEVLVEADLRGIDSHGVAHVRGLYVNRLQDGRATAQPNVQVVAESPTTAVMDADAGLGHPVAYRAMQLALSKARQWGSGFVTVRNSNHYGIAGYYATMALEHDCIGFSMTNSGPLVTPTFGTQGVLGTNPIAVAAPADQEPPFILDMATSTIAHGKLEIYDRLGKPIPIGWVVDSDGQPVEIAEDAMAMLRQRAGGGLLPLGGAGELGGGHKGYGLGLWVEIFCALLSGTPSPYVTFTQTGDRRSYLMSHFFGAWQIEQFRPLEAFKADMDALQRHLREAPKATGQTRIYVPGEKEMEARARRSHQGIPLDGKVLADLQALANELGVVYDL